MCKLEKHLQLLLLLAALWGLNACKKDNASQPPDGSPSPPTNGKRWVVTSMAGNGVAALVNGPVSNSSFHFPEDVVFFNDGSAFVTDVFNSVIRKIGNGQVTSFAGSGEFGISDGVGIAAKFKYPFSITSDGTGALYVTDEEDPRIRKINASGEVTTYAGMETPGFADGAAAVSQFGPGNYLVSDGSGNVFVSDAMNNRIRKISGSGQVTSFAGTGVPGFHDGGGSSAQFNFPGGIAVDKQGNLYVADRGNFRIRKISPDGSVSTVAGSGTPGYKDGAAAEAQFTLDMRDLVCDSDGNLYLSEGDRIRQISPEGLVSTIAGSNAGFQDGDGQSARFNYPNGMCIDGQGKIYVADLQNNRIRKISFE